MSPLEQAIRNAIDRADRANPDVRARIYQSARNALETGLRKQEVADGDVIARQREKLEATIRAIENEELERLASIARLEKVMLETVPEEGQDAGQDNGLVDHPQSGQDMRAGDFAPDVRPDPQVEPMTNRAPDVELGGNGPRNLVHDGRSAVKAERARMADRVLAEAHRDEDALLADLAAGRPGDAVSRHEEEDPAWAAPNTPAASRVAPARKGRIRRAGSAIVALFVYAMILGSLGAGGWWVYSTGIWKSLAERSGNIPDVTPQSEAEDFDPAASPLDPQRGFSGDWIKVFKPGEGKTTPHSAATSSKISDSDGDAVLITSSQPDSKGEVEIEIPADVLQNLAGKSAIFAITARADGEDATQIYVECDFGSLGTCGRHRYPIVQDRADQLLKVNFAGKLAPSEPGHLLINSDVTGKGAAIRVYGVRVLPAN